MPKHCTITKNIVTNDENCIWLVRFHHPTEVRSILAHISYNLFRDAKEYTGLCHCQSRDDKALDFAFNMSLSTINIAKAFGKQQEVPLSVGDVKTMLHNATMVERLFSMFGKCPNVKINNTDFKELLFYGLKAAV